MKPMTCRKTEKPRTDRSGASVRPWGLPGLNRADHGQSDATQDRQKDHERDHECQHPAREVEELPSVAHLRTLYRGRNFEVISPAA